MRHFVQQPMWGYFDSLRFRLIVFALLASLPSLVLALTLNVEQRRHDAAQVQLNAFQVVREIAKSQSILIEDTRLLLQTLAATPQMRYGVADACSAFVSSLLASSPMYQSLGVATASGDVFCGAPHSITLTNIEDHSYFRRALTQRAFAVDSLTSNRKPNQPGLVFAWPIVEPDGTVDRVVLASANLEWLSRQIDPALLLPGSIVTVVDQNGLILARHPYAEQWIGRPIEEDMAFFQSVLSQRRGTTESIGRDGIRRLYAFTPLELFHDSGPILVLAAIPSEIAYERANSLWHRNVIWFFSMTFFMLIIAWAGGQVIIRKRVQALVHAAQRLASGDLSTRIGFEAQRDELGQLGDAFDQMAASLQVQTERLTQVNRLLNMIKECQKALVRRLDETALLQEVCQTIVQSGDYYAAWIGRVDTDDFLGDVIHCVAYAGPDHAGFIPDRIICSGGAEAHPACHALWEQRAVLVQDYETETSGQSLRAHAEQFGYRSSISLPILIQGRACAVLTLYDVAAHSFDEVETDFLNELAGDIAHGLAMARAAQAQQKAEDETRRQAARAESLVRTAARLNDQLDVDTIINLVCEETRDALAVDGVSVSLYDERHQRFYKVAVVGLPAGYHERIRPVSRSHIDRLIARTAAQFPSRPQDHLIVRQDLQLEADDENYAVYMEFDVRSMASIAMTDGDEVVGRLNVHVLHEPRTFTSDDLALLRGLANQAAQAVRNARLYAEAQRRLDRLHTLHVIDRSILQVQELAATLRVIVRQVSSQLEIDAARVLLYNSESRTLQYMTGVGFRTGTMQNSRLALGEGYAGRAAQTRTIQYVVYRADAEEGIQRDPMEEEGLFEEEGFVSYYAIPLVAQDELMGVLDIFHRSTLDPDPEWLEFLEGLALQTAIAIRHAQLFTQTRRLLQQTQTQARQLQQIMDTVPEGVLVLDQNCRIVLANQAAQTQLTWLGNARPGEILTHLGDHPIAEYLAPAPTTAMWRELVLEHLHTVYEVAVGTSQLANQIEGRILIIRDVTLDRQRQQYLQVQERLATVGQLAAGIAHDFNNILTPILLYTDITMAGLPEGSRARANLNQVLAAVHRAKDLVAQILTFSRQGNQSVRKPVQIQPVLKEALKLARAVLPSTIEIFEQIDPDAGVVMADPTQIHRVIMNLCTNAFHAMREKGGRLTVSLDSLTVDADFAALRPNLQLGRYVRISVSDTGHGIDSAIIDRIFDPFFTTKAAGEGTGMGLAVVYGIVKAHDGDIMVHSVVGHGATFHIYLPQVIEDDESSSRVLAPPPRGVEHILVVDDEQVIAQITQEILQNLGYEVTTHTDSVETLEDFRGKPNAYDLVVTDLTMPKLTGDELARELLNIRPDLPIVLMTGSGETVSSEVVRSLGIRGYLMKPFSATDLGHTLRHALDQPAPLESQLQHPAKSES